MAVSEISGTVRDGRKKGFNRRLRADGHLPAVVYGQHEPLAFTVNPKELKKILEKNGMNTLIELSLEGDSAKRTVILKDHQVHMITDQWLHADFYEIDKSEKLKVNVRIDLIGHSPAEKMGGLVEQHLHDIEIRCLPENIPDKIEVDMTKVQMDQIVHVSDLVIPEADKIEVMDNPGEAVVAVHEVKVVEEAKPEDELEGVAPGEAAKAPADDKAADSEDK